MLQFLYWQFNGGCSAQNYIRIDENLSLHIRDFKNKKQDECIVTDCIRWMGEVIKKSTLNSPVTRTLRDKILMGTTGHIPLTVWGNLINKITENVGTKQEI